jgi:hypothetical protein
MFGDHSIDSDAAVTQSSNAMVLLPSETARSREREGIEFHSYFIDNTFVLRCTLKQQKTFDEQTRSRIQKSCQIH